MFANPLIRLAIGIPVAIVVTLILFHSMRLLISADFEEPDNLREYNLESITPEAEEEQVTRRARNKPRKLNNALAIDPVAISDRDAQPIRPPVPTYPSRAAERGIEGSCDVRFDVDTRGEPYNVTADCTDRVFKREAERAVSRVEFAPKIIRGQAAERRNVVYPLEFTLAE